MGLQSIDQQRTGQAPMNSVRASILGGVLVAAVALTGCAGSSYPQEAERAEQAGLYD